jgi:site-specific DNA recombinase
MSENRKLRCAVYTRKSSEEGLDQAFNSLDAQREACVAYIASQASLGWTLVPDLYDDGGISGGTLERPGIQRLLEQIKEGRIDVVVVYKIDRLTRSLMDFAKLVDVFDGHSVSFVSVTQQFNTTTSMGRLTLNVLLSFAQFEREVTAERIRDKVAASKKKGIWMGGNVSMGYRVQDRKLLIDEPVAKQVRRIFSRYLELRSVHALTRELNMAGSGGAEKPVHSRGKIYHLLANPIYIGKIRHQGQLYDGEHQAIIDTETFERVQQLLADQAANPRGGVVHADGHLLTGRIFDEHGKRLTPVHATTRGKRYRYYVSDPRRAGSTPVSNGWKIAATVLEPVVEGQMIQILKNRSQLARWIQQCGNAHDIHELLSATAMLEERIAGDSTKAFLHAVIRVVIKRITVGSEWLRYDVDVRGLIDVISNHTQYLDPNGIVQSITKSERSQPHDLSRGEESGIVQISQAFALKRRGVERRMILDDTSARQTEVDQSLIDTLAKAHIGLAALTDGSKRGIAEVAKSLDMDGSDLSRILPLAFLSPKITEAILSGRQPEDLTLRKLTRGIDLPIDWTEQNKMLTG